MPIKIRKVEAAANKDQFCACCLKSKYTGEKELFQIRIRSKGSVFDFFLCKDCFVEFDNEIDRVIQDVLL